MLDALLEIQLELVLEIFQNGGSQLVLTGAAGEHVCGHALDDGAKRHSVTWGLQVLSSELAVSSERPPRNIDPENALLQSVYVSE